MFLSSLGLPPKIHFHLSHPLQGCSQQFWRENVIDAAHHAQGAHQGPHAHRIGPAIGQRPKPRARGPSPRMHQLACTRLAKPVVPCAGMDKRPHAAGMLAAARCGPVRGFWPRNPVSSLDIRQVEHFLIHDVRLQSTLRRLAPKFIRRAWTCRSSVA
jgi:hypothetical protein